MDRPSWTHNKYLIPISSYYILVECTTTVIPERSQQRSHERF